MIRKIDYHTWQLLSIGQGSVGRGSAWAVLAMNTKLVEHSLIEQEVWNWVWRDDHWDYGGEAGAGAVVAAPTGSEMDDN